MGKTKRRMEQAEMDWDFLAKKMGIFVLRAILQ